MHPVKGHLEVYTFQFLPKVCCLKSKQICMVKSRTNFSGVFFYGGTHSFVSKEETVDFPVQKIIMQ